MSEAQNQQGQALPDPIDSLNGMESVQAESGSEITEITQDAIATPATSAQAQPAVFPTQEKQPTPEPLPDLLPDLIESNETDEFLLSLHDENLAGGELAEALAWQSDTDVAELVTLSEALRNQNNELMAHVEQLEKLLDECHTALQSQIERTQTAEAKAVQQASELHTTQEQITRVFGELEASQQIAHRQQILIETLTQQLQGSQERVAQLERQCALVQQRYNEQTQILLKSETTCQELQDRLQRQQRYTLQFKAALDKCLEMPSLKPKVSQPETEEQRTQQNLHPLIFSPRPIQPWSAATSESNLQESEKEQAEVSGRESANFQVELSPEALISNESELAPDIEYFGNPFFSIPEPETTSESDLTGSPPLPADSTFDFKEAEEALWKELERLTNDTVELKNISLPDHREVADPATSIPVTDEAIAELAQTKSLPQLETQLPSPVTSPELKIAAVPTAGNTPNWPSPVVYPQRPTKKIKSLAAIDLPSFPPLKKG